MDTSTECFLLPVVGQSEFRAPRKGGMGEVGVSPVTGATLFQSLVVRELGG